MFGLILGLALLIMWLGLGRWLRVMPPRVGLLLVWLVVLGGLVLL